MDDWQKSYLIAYGPEANCTLVICPIQASIYQYRPSRIANGLFIGLFGSVIVVQMILLSRYRRWRYGLAIIIGSTAEILGYAGRILLYRNPFSFNAFLLQIICITFAPVYYTAAIYFTLSDIVVHLGEIHSRFSAKVFTYVFIISDVVALVLQATGGAMSSTTSGTDQVGIDIALAGLSFQVASLTLFICLAMDYFIRFLRNTPSDTKTLSRRGVMFAYAMMHAVILILIRCAYRIAELYQGYSGRLVHNEGLFIGLEGACVCAAAIFLCIGHPGILFGPRKAPSNQTGQLTHLR